MQQVKAIDHVEDANQTPVPDGNGGFNLETNITVLTAGEIYTLPDDQAQRLEKLGYVSFDLDSPLRPHLTKE